MNRTLKNKYLILLVGPSASGKTHLLDYIRKQGHQAIVSTTTRLSRPGEVEGVDYYFIDEHTSQKLKDEKGFVEAVEYAGVRYGVTHKEFNDKIKAGNGLAVLIVEPNGIYNYRNYCYKAGVKVHTVYMDTNPEIRFGRLKDLAEEQTVYEDEHLYSESGVNRIIRSAIHESNWKNLHYWDVVLDGANPPEENYKTLLSLSKGLK